MGMTSYYRRFIKDYAKIEAKKDLYLRPSLRPRNLKIHSSPETLSLHTQILEKNSSWLSMLQATQ